MVAQLICTVCKTKRELTEDEVKESIEIINKKNLDADAILSIWNLFGGECPEGGGHEYDWNTEFFQKMLDDSQTIRKNNGEMTRKNNENLELAHKVDQLKTDTENKIKEIEEKIAKNKESNIALEKANTELKDSTLRTSGRDWNSWL